MRAGRLRHRVWFDSPVATKATDGQRVISFVASFIVWAGIEPLRGTEGIEAGQNASGMDTRIIVRWSSSIEPVTPKWRIRHDGVIYNIKSKVHRNLARREVEFMCETSTAA